MNLKLFRAGIDMLYILLVYVISMGVLQIAIYLIYNSGKYSPETLTAFQMFFYLLTFVSGCKIILIGYDTYKGNK